MARIAQMAVEAIQLFGDINPNGGQADFLLDAFEQLFARNGAGGDGDVVFARVQGFEQTFGEFLLLMREQFGKLDAQIGDDGLNRIQSLYNGLL